MPEACAGRTLCGLPSVLGVQVVPFSLSDAIGEAQPANCPTFGSSCLPTPAEPRLSAAIVVGQPARRATSFSGRAFSPCLLLALDFQSRAAAVGQGVRSAASTSVVPEW